MTRTRANSARAGAALTLVEDLQRRFVSQLEVVADAVGDPTRLQPVEWLRDDGRHGGGVRFVAGSDKGSQVFNRASVNVSQVHYDDLPNKRLGSATALSCIIHPANPHASSMHMHISWTELRDGGGTWRVMADLNPAIAETAPAAAFEACLREAAGGQWDHGRAQGDRYFAIPALDRHRGVVHFYLEGFATDDEAADRAFAERVGQQVIATYCDTLRASILAHPAPTAEDRDQQLAYHTVYLFQVLTLDRGTTSGLLVHDQNDVGILGSLPSHVDRERLRAWQAKVPPPQDALVQAIVGALPDDTPSPVDEPTKRTLAATVRSHYRAHPEALALQASGDVIPPTVDNHR